MASDTSEIWRASTYRRMATPIRLSTNSCLGEGEGEGGDEAEAEIEEMAPALFELAPVKSTPLVVRVRVRGQA